MHPVNLDIFRIIPNILQCAALSSAGMHTGKHLSCTSKLVYTIFDTFSLNTDCIVLGPFREMLSCQTPRECIFSVH
jgi:hypothetical protein